MSLKTWALCAVLLMAAPQAEAAVGVYNSVNVVYSDASGYHVDHAICGPTASDIVGSCGAPGLNVSASAGGGANGTLHAQVSTTLTDFDAVLTTSPSGVQQIGLLNYGVAVLFDAVSFGGVTPSTLRFSYLVNGIVQSNAPAGTFGRAGSAVELGTDQAGYTTFQRNNPTWDPSATARAVSYSGHFDVPVVGNDPVGFALLFYAVNLFQNPTGTDLNGSVSSLFHNTAHFGLQALDADGNDITTAAQFQFVDEGLPRLAAIPEPSTWALLISGFGLTGTALRRRRLWVLRAAS